LKGRGNGCNLVDDSFEQYLKVDENVMRTKVVCWCSATAVVLVVSTMMLVNWNKRRNEPDWIRNEVINYVFLFAEEMLCVEKKETNPAATEVFFMCAGFGYPLVQHYTIEGDTVKNYYWGIDRQEIDVPKLPWDDLNSMSVKEVETQGSITSIANVINKWQFREPWQDNSQQEDLEIRKWSGATDKTPGMVTDFCDAVIVNVSNPDYAKNKPFSWKSNNSVRQMSTFDPSFFHFGHRIYPSYLRATPLHTGEELEQAKDIPLIDFDLSKFTMFAVNSSYLLIPVHVKKSPFPSLNKPYEPGLDKVRVKAPYENGREAFFLVETFKGEAWQD